MWQKRYNAFNLSRELKSLCWLKLFFLKNHPATFGSHSHCVSEDITYSIFSRDPARLHNQRAFWFYWGKLLIVRNNPWIAVVKINVFNHITTTDYWWPKEFRTVLCHYYCLFLCSDFFHYPDAVSNIWYV